MTTTTYYWYYVNMTTTKNAAVSQPGNKPTLTKPAKKVKPIKQMRLNGILVTKEKLEEIEKAKELEKSLDSFIFSNATLKKITKEQMSLCKKTAILWGLNPLKREIHFVPHEIKVYDQVKKMKIGTGKYDVAIVIGYEVYIARAEKTGKLDGWDVVFEGEGEKMKGIITIYRKDWTRPFKHEVWLSEARQYGPMWDKQPRFQLRKTCIGQGFRLCFPEHLGGLPYIAEEIGVGTIEQDGKLSLETEKSEPKELLAPKKIMATEWQIKEIDKLIFQKGQDPQVIFDFFKVKTFNGLTINQAGATILRLKTMVDRRLDETVDPVEVDKGIAEMKEKPKKLPEIAPKIKKLSDDTVKEPNPPATRMQIAWISTHYVELVNLKLLDKDDSEKIEFMSEKEYNRLFKGYKDSQEKK